MRKSFLLMLAITALCFSTTAQKNDWDNDNKKRIEGSGNVITKDIQVKSFNDLTAYGVFSLQLSQGDKEAVKIEAEDNLIDLIIVENEGSTLKISMKKDVSINSKKKMTVYVTFKNLKSMYLSMVGGTSSDEQLKFSELKFKNQSVGSVNLDMALQTLNLENESVGTLKLKGSADNAVIKSNSVGSMVEMEITGLGRLSNTIVAEESDWSILEGKKSEVRNQKSEVGSQKSE